MSQVTQHYQQAVINLVQAQANRFTNLAALFMAAIGGWWISSLKNQDLGWTGLGRATC